MPLLELVAATGADVMAHEERLRPATGGGIYACPGRSAVHPVLRHAETGYTVTLEEVSHVRWRTPIDPCYGHRGRFATLATRVLLRDRRTVSAVRPVEIRSARCNGPSVLSGGQSRVSPCLVEKVAPAAGVDMAYLYCPRVPTRSVASAAGALLPTRCGDVSRNAARYDPFGLLPLCPLGAQTRRGCQTRHQGRPGGSSGGPMQRRFGLVAMVFLVASLLPAASPTVSPAQADHQQFQLALAGVDSAGNDTMEGPQVSEGRSAKFRIVLATGHYPQLPAPRRFVVRWKVVFPQSPPDYLGRRFGKHAWASADDVTQLSGRVVFRKGDLSRTFRVPIADDALPEHPENFYVKLVNPPFPIFKSSWPYPAPAEIRMNDGYVKPVSADLSINKGRGPTSLTFVNRGPGVARDVELRANVYEGEDEVPISGTVSKGSCRPMGENEHVSDIEIGNILCSIGDLAPNESVTLQVPDVLDDPRNAYTRQEITAAFVKHDRSWVQDPYWGNMREPGLNAPEDGGNWVGNNFLCLAPSPLVYGHFEC